MRVQLDPKTPPTYADVGKVDRSSPDGYALFAFQPEDQFLRKGLKFRVTLSWLPVNQLNRRRAALNKELARANRPLLPPEVADISDDLRDAALAWVNFGGIGGRTRRGYFYCNRLPVLPVEYRWGGGLPVSWGERREPCLCWNTLKPKNCWPTPSSARPLSALARSI